MMRKLSLIALCVLAAGIGCNQPTSTATTDQSDTSGTTATNQPETKPTDHSVEGHAHGAGPHDGTIADWGGGTFHVEFTVDHDKKQATVYILGGDEKTPSPIDSETIELSLKDPQLQLILSADPQEGDPEGKSSRYSGTDEKLGIVQEYAGTMTGVVDGTPYSGDFDEKPHDHE